MSDATCVILGAVETAIMLLVALKASKWLGLLGLTLGVFENCSILGAVFLMGSLAFLAYLTWIAMELMLVLSIVGYFALDALGNPREMSCSV